MCQHTANLALTMHSVVISDVRLGLSPHFSFVYLTTMVTYLDISFMFFQERKIIFGYALH